MNKIINQVMRLFNEIDDVISNEANDYSPHDHEDIKIQVYEIILILDKLLNKLLESSKNEQIPNIIKTSLEWLENDFKPKLVKFDKEETNSSLNFWDDFLIKRSKLSDFIRNESEKKDKLFKNWISEKGFNAVKCTRCGDGHWHFSSKVDNCVCYSCLEKEFEENQK